MMSASEYRLLTVAIPLPNAGVSLSLELCEHLRVRYMIVGSSHGQTAATLGTAFQVGAVLAYVVQEDFTSYPQYRPPTASKLKSDPGRSYLIAAAPLPKGLVISLNTSPLFCDREKPYHFKGFSWDKGVTEDHLPLGEPNATYDPAVGGVVLTKDLLPFDRIWIASPTFEKLKEIQNKDTEFIFPEDLFARNIQHLSRLWRHEAVTLLPDLLNTPRHYFAVEISFMVTSLFVGDDDDNPFLEATRDKRPCLRALRAFLFDFYKEIVTVAPPARKSDDEGGQLAAHIFRIGKSEVETWFQEHQAHPWYLNVNLGLDKALLILRQRVSLLMEYQRLILRTPVGLHYERAPSADWQRKKKGVLPGPDKALVVLSFGKTRPTAPSGFTTPVSSPSTFSTPTDNEEYGDSITLTPLKISTAEKCGTLDEWDGIKALCGISPSPSPPLCLGTGVFDPPCGGLFDPVSQFCETHHAAWLALVPAVRDVLVTNLPRDKPTRVGPLDPSVSLWDFLVQNPSSFDVAAPEETSWCVGFFLHPRYAPDCSPRLITVTGPGSLVTDLSSPFAGPALQVTWSPPTSMDEAVTPVSALSFSLRSIFVEIWPRLDWNIIQLPSNNFTFPNIQLLAWSTCRKRFWEDTISTTKGPLVQVLLGPCAKDTPQALLSAVRIDFTVGINFWKEVGDRWLPPPLDPLPAVPISSFPVVESFTPLRPPPLQSPRPPSTMERLFSRLASPGLGEPVALRDPPPSPGLFSSPPSSRFPPSAHVHPRRTSNPFGYPVLRPIGGVPLNSPSLLRETPIMSNDLVGNNDGVASDNGDSQGPPHRTPPSGRDRVAQPLPSRRTEGASGGGLEFDLQAESFARDDNDEQRAPTLVTLLSEMQRATRNQTRIAEQEVLLKELENEALLFGDKKSSGGVTAAEIHQAWKQVALLKKAVGVKGHKFGGVGLVAGAFSYHLVETFNSGAGVLGTRAFWQERPYLIPTSLLVAIGLDDWCPGRGLDPGMLTKCFSLDTLMNPLKHRSAVTNPLPKPGPTCQEYLNKESWYEIEKRFLCIFRLYGDAWGDFWYELYSQAFKEFCVLRLTDFYYFNEARSVRIFQKSCWDYQRLFLQLVNNLGVVTPGLGLPLTSDGTGLAPPTAPPYASVASVYDVKDLPRLVALLPGFSFDPMNPDSEYFLSRIYEERDGVITAWQGKQLSKYLGTQDSKDKPPKSTGVGAMQNRPSYMELEKRYPRSQAEKLALKGAISSVITALGLPAHPGLCLKSISMDGCDHSPDACSRTHLSPELTNSVEVPLVLQRYLIRFGGYKGTYATTPLVTIEQRLQAYKALGKKLPKPSL